MVSSLSDPEVNNRGNLIDRGRNFRLNEFVPRTKHRRRTRTKKSSEHSVGVENAHYIGPYPPPECPQRHQGTVAISAWPDFVANSTRARRKTRSEPCLGSNHSSAPPGVKSIASFRT